MVREERFLCVQLILAIISTESEKQSQKSAQDVFPTCVSLFRRHDFLIALLVAPGVSMHGPNGQCKKGSRRRKHADTRSSTPGAGSDAGESGSGADVATKRSTHNLKGEESPLARP